MRYAVLGGGKRLRAFVALESAAIFRVPPGQALRTAAAVECVHAYSLVHDDLPCMDDDDMRRGKPTVHKVWDEATAVLAGDALQTLAFEVITAPQSAIDPRAAGAAGLAAGAGGGRARHGRRAGARHRGGGRRGAARPRGDDRPAGAEDRGAVRLGGRVGGDPRAVGSRAAAALRGGARARLPDPRRHARRRGRRRGGRQAARQGRRAGQGDLRLAARARRRAAQGA